MSVHHRLGVLCAAVALTLGAAAPSVAATPATQDNTTNT